MRILFIEDDPMNRQVVRDMLKVAGAETDEARDAETGLRLIDERDYDLVLLDLRMPGMDGLEAVARVRARADAKRALPLVIVTADTAPHLRQRCLAAGADDVLMKPIAMNALFDVISRTLLRGDGEVVIS